jgi:hypothetical protein
MTRGIAHVGVKHMTGFFRVSRQLLISLRDGWDVLTILRRLMANSLASPSVADHFSPKMI